MPIKIDTKLTPQKLVPKIERLFELSAEKILSLEKTWKPADGAPVFTVKGRYTSRGWTEWTQGFQYGSALLQFDAMEDERFLEIGRRGTIECMATHVSHFGVHDHGFNNISTYGNLLRLMREGKIPHNENEKNFYELALKVSGAVQASRWTKLADGTGFIHSFNGPHSLFVDTIRSCRSLAVAHQLGHTLMGEQDAKISLLQRLVEHTLNTARYNIFYGEGRDVYDVRGRTAHEAVFNTASGVFRCPNSQQGYSPFSTWTRGLAWAICGFAEQLEFFSAISQTELRAAVDPEHEDRIIAPIGAATVIKDFAKAGTSTADFYLANCFADGIPMWDTEALNLQRLPASYLDRPSNPYNRWEPVDSSAAAIAAQGLLRLGRLLLNLSHTQDNHSAWLAQLVDSGAFRPMLKPTTVDPRNCLRDIVVRSNSLREAGTRYRQAALSIARTLFSEPYISSDPAHEGLILHSVYHRPNGWDYIAPGQEVPNGESSMWGDYHARELALLLLREARGEHYLTFFGGCQ